MDLSKGKTSNTMFVSSAALTSNSMVAANLDGLGGGDNYFNKIFLCRLFVTLVENPLPANAAYKNTFNANTTPYSHASTVIKYSKAMKN